MNTNESRSKRFFSRMQSLDVRALQYTEHLHIFDSAIIGIELNSKDKYVLTFSVHKMFKIASKMGVRHNSVRMFIKKCIPKDLLTNVHSPLFRYADHRDTITMTTQNIVLTEDFSQVNWNSFPLEFSRFLKFIDLILFIVLKLILFPLLIAFQLTAMFWLRLDLNSFNLLIYTSLNFLLVYFLPVPAILINVLNASYNVVLYPCLDKIYILSEQWILVKFLYYLNN